MNTVVVAARPRWIVSVPPPANAKVPFPLTVTDAHSGPTLTVTGVPLNVAVVGGAPEGRPLHVQVRRPEWAVRVGPRPIHRIRRANASPPDCIAYRISAVPVVRFVS